MLPAVVSGLDGSSVLSSGACVDGHRADGAACDVPHKLAFRASRGELQVSTDLEFMATV
jgi:hypothetical protein